MREKVLKAIEKFNKYRKPEAVAELLEIKGDKIKVRFTGSFCTTCGLYDYFDDFLVFLEEEGIKGKREKIEEIENGAVVEFFMFS